MLEVGGSIPSPPTNLLSSSHVEIKPCPYNRLEQAVLILVRPARERARAVMQEHCLDDPRLGDSEALIVVGFKHRFARPCA
jgi:hypothetical protein